MELKGKKILITGGSAGIGKAMIKELIRHGVKDIAVIGRKKDKLDQLESDFDNVDFLSLQGDVSKIEDLERSVETIKKKWGALDILINNAGVVSAGLLSDVSDEDIIAQININVTGLILLTKKCLPLLKNSKEGAIINVSSGLGYVAMPFYSVYATTKAGVRQFSDALRRELHMHPLHIMTVYPTATDTNMMESADVNGMDSPEEVAKASIEGLLKGKINIVMGGEEKEEQAKMNFLQPKKMDEIAINNYDDLKQRTTAHRSM